MQAVEVFAAVVPLGSIFTLFYSASPLTGKPPPVIAIVALIYADRE